MWMQIKRWLGANDGSDRSSNGGGEYAFKWLDPGDDNPFPLRVLDVRGLTWNVVATTGSVQIAESFNAQRLSDGREHIDAKIENPVSVESNLVFPRNEDWLDGVVFKSGSMEVKWDIYSYDSVFLFVRSWTGELQFRAFAEITDSAICIHNIESSTDRIETAPQTVCFLLASHAMGRVLPHTIPRDVPDDPQQLGLWSFSMFGKLACYATYEDNTRIEFNGLQQFRTG